MINTQGNSFHTPSNNQLQMGYIHPTIHDNYSEQKIQKHKSSINMNFQPPKLNEYNSVKRDVRLQYFDENILIL